PPPPAPVQQAAPANGAVPHRNGSNGAAAQVQAHAPAQGAQQQAPRQAQAPAQQQARPAQPQPRQQRRPAYVEESQSGISEVSEIPRRRCKGGGSAQVTIGILLLAMVGGGGYFVYGRWKAEKTREYNSKMQEGQKEIRHDSYDGYKKAIDAANKALDAEPKGAAAHAMLAYAHAIRWGEHGSAEDRGPAEEHLADAVKYADKPTALQYAAEALIPYYSGDSKKALDVIAKNIDKTGGRGPTLFLTQGIIMMN